MCNWYRGFDSRHYQNLVAGEHGQFDRLPGPAGKVAQVRHGGRYQRGGLRIAETQLINPRSQTVLAVHRILPQKVEAFQRAQQVVGGRFRQLKPAAEFADAQARRLAAELAEDIERLPNGGDVVPGASRRTIVQNG